jgi:hypothetical protein
MYSQRRLEFFNVIERLFALQHYVITTTRSQSLKSALMVPRPARLLTNSIKSSRFLACLYNEYLQLDVRSELRIPEYP